MKQYSLTVIKKLSDSRLEDILDLLSDNGDSSSAYYLMINNELNLRAQLENLLVEKKKQKELEKELKLQALAEELEALRTSSSKRVVMKAMVEEFGGEFKDDYKVNYEKFTVESMVKSKYADESGAWAYSNIEDALYQVHVLIYYRVYNQYFRNVDSSTEGNLLRLRAAMASILAE